MPQQEAEAEGEGSGMDVDVQGQQQFQQQQGQQQQQQQQQQGQQQRGGGGGGSGGAPSGGGVGSSRAAGDAAQASSAEFADLAYFTVRSMLGKRVDTRQGPGLVAVVGAGRAAVGRLGAFPAFPGLLHRARHAGQVGGIWETACNEGARGSAIAYGGLHLTGLVHAVKVGERNWAGTRASSRAGARANAGARSGVCGPGLLHSAPHAGWVPRVWRKAW